MARPVRLTRRIAPSPPWSVFKRWINTAGFERCDSVKRAGFRASYTAFEESG